MTVSRFLEDRWSHALAAAIIFVFLLQALTGICLALFYVPAVDQTELGRRLAAEYKIRPAYELTDCTTCHR